MRFFAFLILVSQLVIPVTPAFADEISPTEVSIQAEESLQPTEKEEIEERETTSVVEVVEPPEETQLREEDAVSALDKEESSIVDDTVYPDESLKEVPVTDEVVEVIETVDEEVPQSTSILLDQDTGDSDTGDPGVVTDGGTQPEPVATLEEEVSAPSDETSTDSILEETSPEPVTEENGTTTEEFQNEEVEENIEVTPDVSDVPEAPDLESGTTTDIIASEPATTTYTVAEPEYHYVLNDENRYTFSSDECARVADGSFYCTTEKATTTTNSDRVFSGPDQDGDNEIFIERDGVVTQMTFNLVDDAAPFYDPASETLVWHRLDNARYQIVTLDLETEEETQLTFDSYNNMQPSRNDDLVVWQGWIGNDWEIMMRDKDEITMLTDNTTHDIGPRINGEFIIWQSEEAGGWKVRVYNTETKVTETIDDAQGASIENPRLVLVYDAKHGNGDVETRGYDLDSGKNVSLSSEAPEVPDELPDPDQTGEKRALINGAQLKTKADEDEDEPEPLPFVPEEPLLDTGTTTDEGDIMIPPFEIGTSTDEILEEVTQDEAPLVLDLVIPPVSEVTEEQPIPDLVIPPLETAQTESTDPQGEVAGTI